VHTTAGTLHLSSGGAVLTIEGNEHLAAPDTEYDGIYAHFARLLATSESAVDLSPLQLVADAFMLADIRQVEPFPD
jgi:hypothetical protein